MNWIRSHLLALGAWEVCVIGSLIALAAWKGNLTPPDKEDIVDLSVVVGSGVLVVAAVSIFGSSLGKLGGFLTGLACGLLPSVLMLIYIWVVPPGFEKGAAMVAGTIAFSVPSAVGGGVAGLICSWQSENPVIE
jgi:hypothetical protein